jgi:hypothetical protein
MGKALRIMRLQLADYLVTLIGLCFTFLSIWPLTWKKFTKI